MSKVIVKPLANSINFKDLAKCASNSFTVTAITVSEIIKQAQTRMKGFIHSMKNVEKIVSLMLFSMAATAGNQAVAAEQAEADYTVPSWTLYQRALIEAERLLVPKNYVYNINTTINGDPKTQIGVSWFTNEDITDTKIQVKVGKDVTDFTGAMEINATVTPIANLVYIAKSNNNTEIAEASGFPKGTTRNYTSNKALITGLQPNTTYSYRIGKEEYWSKTGVFTTAPADKSNFEFIYITDTQANTDEMFDVSKKTIDAARIKVPDSKFLLCAGDFVETYHIPGYEDYGYSGSAEWEWEQWFEKMQTTCLSLPIVPLQGNHDISPTSNWFNHFNTNKSYNASQSNSKAKTNMEGTIYSFVYGDALFVVMSFENIPLPYVESEDNDVYINAVADWVRAEVAKYPDIKWKIAAYHKSMFTGSASHQDDGDSRFVRENIAPLLQELDFDLALQGHDHVYEVMGVFSTKKENGNITYEHLPSAVSNQALVTPTAADGTVNCVPTVSVTGKNGGTFNVANGMVYLLNNSAGKKKYYPRNEEQMNSAIEKHGISNYFSLFNKFGQTGEPTFSSVKVSTDTITVATYTVNNDGVSSLFDEFKIVKTKTGGIDEIVTQPDELKLFPNPADNNSVTVEISTVDNYEQIEEVTAISLSGKAIKLQRNGNVLDLSNITNGTYILNVKTAKATYSKRFIVNKTNQKN